MTTKRFWKVRCSVLKAYGTNPQRTYKARATVGVVSETAESAIAAVRALIPGTVIYAPNDHWVVGIED